uniref:Putative reverse transcriptase and intron maturase n=1 Tax=Eutreptiella pomquetensis TaxID=215699 RepID=A0A223FLW7_9EUGL|nr:putative reverse transcriptase and intron maturase [Eutreptiella pomquetensis]
MSIKTWLDVDWALCEQRVYRLQKRIFTASQAENKGKVHFLQRKILCSLDAKLIAVRRITQINKGRKIPGIDKKRIKNNKEKLLLARNLRIKGKASTIRAVCINKAGKDEKRSLGIPIIEDRVLQMLVKLALEPEWEAKFEPNSYGFRPGRNSHDAIRAVFNQSRHKSQFVLDADIRKCFETISHQKLLKKLKTFPLIENQMKAWLTAGIMEKYSLLGSDKSIPNPQGTPQGSVISPLLANIALHGMEDLTKEYYSKNFYKGPSKTTLKDRKSQIGLIRYADDFVVLHKDEQVVHAIKALLSTWLYKHMGLELSSAKTSIKSTDNGYEFLGFHITSLNVKEKNKPKCQISVSKTSKKKFLDKTRRIMQNNRAIAAGHLIILLSPIIIGWSNYFKYAECSTSFGQVKYGLFGQVRAWVFRRKSLGLRSRTKLKEKYFPPNTTVKFNGKVHTGNWIFTGTVLGRRGNLKQVFLPYPSWVLAKRWVKVKQKSSPFDGQDIYWSHRNIQYCNWNKRTIRLVKLQNYNCPICQRIFMENDILEIDHIIPIALGGTDNIRNLQVVHDFCHVKKSTTDKKFIVEIRSPSLKI